MRRLFTNRKLEAGHEAKDKDLKPLFGVENRRQQDLHTVTDSGTGFTRHFWWVAEQGVYSEVLKFVCQYKVLSGE